jgi:predicted nucleic acid-binding protein
VKIVLDTNVYVSLLQDRSELTKRRTLLGRILPQTWLSSVVLHELLAGARGDLGRASVRRAMATLERVGRVFAPEPQDWTVAGIVRGQIWEQRRDLRTKSLTNDLLLACSARRIGAFVVTDNRRDFAIIQTKVAFRFGSLDDVASVTI